MHWLLCSVCCIDDWFQLLNFGVGPAQLPLLRSDRNSLVVEPQSRSSDPAFVSVCFQCCSGLIIEMWQLSPFPVQGPSISFWDVFEIHELFQSWSDFMFAENEDFGYCHRIEPPFDPAPDCGKERRCPNYLGRVRIASERVGVDQDLQISCPKSLDNAPLPKR